MANTFIYNNFFDAFGDFPYYGSLLFPHDSMILFLSLKPNNKHFVDDGLQPTPAYFSERDKNRCDETSIILYMCIYNESHDYFENPYS